MRVLVLGGYGLIGSEIVHQLLVAGHEVVGLGRDTVRAARLQPRARWLTADLARLTRPEAWFPVLREAGATAIVNCAGVLQDGVRDDVMATQSRAIAALIEAAPRHGVTLLVQVSAPGADATAPAAFMRSKGEADAALAASDLDWVVLRPGLVMAPQAYGGTALLRALAGMPLVQPVAFADARLHTVAIDDVARAVVLALTGQIERRRTYDLVEDEPHRLGEVVGHLRGWLGLAPAPSVAVPDILVRCVARAADGLGWLGWRPPLRTTAIAQLQAGVLGDPSAWRAQTGASLSSLEVTLARLPSTVQERWFARLFLLKPLVIGTLALFWMATGLITLADPATAAQVLATRGWSASAALAAVVVGAIVDVTLALGVVWRRTMPLAAVGMITTTLVYLAAATVYAPDLWADPLGPLVKAVPAMLLAIVALALAEDR